MGNSLLGTTPELIEAGLPDDAFKPQQGDDRKVCTRLRRRNRAERESGQRDMGYLMVAEPSAEYGSLASRSRWIDESPDDTLGEVRGKEAQFRMPLCPVQPAFLTRFASAAVTWQAPKCAEGPPASSRVALDKASR